MDEIQRISIQVEGEYRLRQLTEQLKAQKETLNEVIELYKRNGGYTGAQAQMGRQTAEGILASQREILELQKQMATTGFRDRFAAMFMGQAAGQMAGQLGQGNIGGAAMGLGHLAGQAAMMNGANPATIVAIGAAAGVMEAVIQNADKISKFLGNIDSGKLKDAAAKMQAAVGEWEKMIAAGTGQQRQQAGAMKGFEAQNPAALDKSIGDILATTGGLPLNEAQRSRVESAKQARSMLGQWLHNPLARAAIGEDRWKDATNESAMQEDIRKQQIATLMTDAAKPGPAGEAARRTIQGFAKQFPGSFTPEQRSQIDRIAQGITDTGRVPDKDMWAQATNPNFVGPPSALSNDNYEAALRMGILQPPPFMTGLRGFVPSGSSLKAPNPADAAASRAEWARRRAAARRGDTGMNENTAPASMLGPDAVMRQVADLEGLLSQSQAMGTGSPQWYSSVEKRLQTLYHRWNQLLQFQSRQLGGQQVHGGYSALGAMWPSQGGG